MEASFRAHSHSGLLFAGPSPRYIGIEHREARSITGMPARLVSVAILAFWLVAAVGLVTRDLLPELLVGDPPDLRTIAGAGDSAEPARWTIQVADDASSEALRTVGGAVTTSLRKPD